MVVSLYMVVANNLYLDDVGESQNSVQYGSCSVGVPIRMQGPV